MSTTIIDEYYVLQLRENIWSIINLETVY